MTRPLAILLLSALCASAASHCVLSSGKGDGSTWAAAMAWPGTMVRGDTYYIGAGTYGAVTLADAGVTTIAIRKATVADHGTDTGWQSSYANPAIFTGTITILASSYVLDGITGSGKTGYGFEVSAGSAYGVNIGAVTNITLRHFDMHEYSATDTIVEKAAWSNPTDLIRAAAGGGNFTFQSNYLHHVFGCPFQWRSLDTVLVERNYIEKNKSTALEHAEGISDNASSHVTLCNNVWVDIEGTGIIVLLSASPMTADGWNIYNNLFWHSGTWGASCAQPIVVLYDANNFSTPANWVIANNTFVNLVQVGSIYAFSPTATNVFIANNMFWQNRTDSSYVNYINIDIYGSGHFRDYNYYSAAVAPWSFHPAAHEPAPAPDPNIPIWPIPPSPLFVNAAVGDFRLTSDGQKPGTNLTALSISGLTADLDGNARPATGAWDIGAYQNSTWTLTLTGPWTLSGAGWRIGQ